MAAALEQLRKTLVSPAGGPIDPVTADWAEIEKGVILLLGGAFSPQKPGHLDVVFMLAAALAERLRIEHGAFWFQNRSTPQGATIGFPRALLVFSPFEVIFETLSRAQLAAVAKVTDDLRAAVARGAAAAAAEGRAFGPADYQRVFDPGLVQFVAFDPDAVKAALDATTETTVADFEHGFGKLSKEIPENVRKQVSREVLGALRRLPSGATLGGEIGRAPQLIEFVTLVMGGKAGTGIAPAEFWEQLLLPLLHVGAAEEFAEPDEEDLQPYREGVDPLLIYVDFVPYKIPAADEDGLLGVFPPSEVKLLDPRWAGAQGVRLLRIDPTHLQQITQDFDAAAVRAAVDRFAELCAKTAGVAIPAPERPEGQPGLIDIVLALGEDLRQMLTLAAEKGWVIGLRYATESEAQSESVLQDLRRAVREPRILLA